VYVIGVEPVQVPFDVLMLFPTMVGPVMAGKAVFLGGARYVAAMVVVAPAVMTWVGAPPSDHDAKA
jgi:hypothetical protein